MSPDGKVGNWVAHSPFCFQGGATEVFQPGQI